MPSVIVTDGGLADAGNINLKALRTILDDYVLIASGKQMLTLLLERRHTVWSLSLRPINTAAIKIQHPSLQKHFRRRLEAFKTERTGLNFVVALNCRPCRSEKPSKSPQRIFDG